MLNLDQLRDSLKTCQSGKEMVHILWQLGEHDMNKAATFLWKWWTMRNKVNEGGSLWSTTKICNSVDFHLMEFEKLKKQEKHEQTTPILNWVPPGQDAYKLNVDASYIASSGRGGWGYVLRDHVGAFLDGRAGSIPRAASVIQAEAFAALQRLERAAELGMSRVILETDAANLGRVLLSEELDGSP